MGTFRLGARSIAGFVMGGMVATACATSEDDEGRSPGGDGDAESPPPVAVDVDDDGIPDGIDSDGDGVADIVGTAIDADGDGEYDSLDTDDDGIADVALPGFTLPEPDGTGGTTTGSGGTTSAVVICDGMRKIGGLEPLIDDFEHPNSADIPEVDNRSGSWFTRNDGSSGGVQTPQDSHPTQGEGRDGSSGFASSARGFEEWGALFGVSLNERDDYSCPYDASAYEGVEFWAKSLDGEAQEISIGLPLSIIIPVERGGTCSGTGCGDSHVTSIVVDDTWQRVVVRWDDVEQGDVEHDNKYIFDPRLLAEITFFVAKNERYDIVIDDVAFIRTDDGLGGAGGMSN